ncbi:MAG: ATP-binding protein [Desulfovibrio sp.]|nr:ATP-binding protein [Desulfovibrio sp.]
MSPQTDEPAGAVFRCDECGRIRHVLADDLGLFLPEAPASFFELVDPASQDKFQSFLTTVERHGAALSWELNIRMSEQAAPMNCFGLRAEGDIFCIVSDSPRNLFSLYDELLRMLNEQSGLLRAAQQECRELRDVDDRHLSDFMRLNNELVNARRELTLRNQEVERQEQRIRRVINAVPDAFLVADGDGRVHFANPAAAALLQEQEQLDASWLSMVGECDGVSREIGLLHGTKLQMTMELRSVPLVWQGRPAFLVSMRDVTEQRKLENVREDMERITRHDIKSPLGGIISLAAMLREEEGLAPNMRRLLGLIEDAGYQVLNMVNMSLDLYKMEQGRYVFQRRCVDLLPIVERSLEEKQAMIRARGLEAVILVNGRPARPGDFVRIRGDETLCYSMVGNLVANAVEASPDFGPVTLSLINNGAEVLFRISNLGAVPREIRDCFFEKYVTAGKKNGTGIGTYSARLIAQTLGGGVEMRTGEEFGTVVTVRLPGVVEIEEDQKFQGMPDRACG